MQDQLKVYPHVNTWSSTLYLYAYQLTRPSTGEKVRWTIGTYWIHNLIFIICFGVVIASPFPLPDLIRNSRFGIFLLR